jgi:hypothetical protein
MMTSLRAASDALPGRVTGSAGGAGRAHSGVLLKMMMIKDGIELRSAGKRNEAMQSCEDVKRVIQAK